MEDTSSQKAARGRPYTKSQCLDFVETAHRGSIYPLVTCRAAYSGQVDIARLTEAVRLSALAVPEMLYSYDYGRGRFVDAGLAAGEAVRAGAGQFDEGWKWDFSRTTQLKILIHEGRLVFGVSHILCDGDGFLQYLYLLAALYNGARPDKGMRNERDIAPLLAGVQVGRPTEREERGRQFLLLSLGADSDRTTYHCLTAQIDAADLTAIRAKAQSLQASLNDAFLAAYARVLAKRLKTDKLLLPCPANLRRFGPEKALTVANMTGMFRIAVEVGAHHRFEDTLAQVHEEMQLQKARRRCFKSMRLLRRMYNKLPSRWVNGIVKRSYDILPLSYTNLGVIDSQRLSFDGAAITDCFLTGAYRYPPDFQLAVSTFQNVCTLNCTLLGGEERRAQAQQILDEVAGDLRDWVRE